MNFRIRENVPLDEYTTLKVGGKAKYFVEINEEADLEKVSCFVKQNNLPFLVIGGGSNLLISDHGYVGLIILNKLKGRKYTKQADGSVLLSCRAGEVFDEVIEETVSLNYWGLENLSSIPGTVGATPVQNVGAYGVDISDTIINTETFHVVTGTKHLLNKEDCKFGYRDSFFKSPEGKNHIITKVCLRLETSRKPKINYADLSRFFAEKEPTQSEIRKAIIEIRAKKFPDWRQVGTAGSFFKNPIISKTEAESLRIIYPELPMYDTNDGRVKIPLGYVLDKICHLKGFREGNIGLYEEQALVLVNYGEKNSDEIKFIADKIIKKVLNETKITIEPEVCFIN